MRDYSVGLFAALILLTCKISHGEERSEAATGASGSTSVGADGQEANLVEELRGTRQIVIEQRQEIARLSKELLTAKTRLSELEREFGKYRELLVELDAERKLLVRRERNRELWLDRFRERMRMDALHYAEIRDDPNYISKIEKEYIEAIRTYGTDQYLEALERFMNAYPESNRAGCVCYRIARELTKRKRYLQARRNLELCKTKYRDCFFGNGCQIGALAYLYEAKAFAFTGKYRKALESLKVLLKAFPGAVDEAGDRIGGIAAVFVDQLKLRLGEKGVEESKADKEVF